MLLVRDALLLVRLSIAHIHADEQELIPTGAASDFARSPLFSYVGRVAAATRSGSRPFALEILPLSVLVGPFRQFKKNP